MIYATFAIFAGVAAYWLILIVLVRRDHGRVGGEARRAMIRMTRSFNELQRQIGIALRPIAERATAAIVEFHEAMKRAGLLDPCPRCGHPPLDHVRCSEDGCVVVEGSLPLRVAVAIPPTYE